MTTNDPNQPNVLTFEAPASWNTRYITPEGFECQLTLRGESGLDLLEKVQGAIGYLLKSGCTPCTSSKFVTRTNNGNGIQAPANGDNHDSGENGNGNGTDRSFCPIHNVTMKRWEKNGRVWFSHKVGDAWCTGKIKTR